MIRPLPPAPSRDNPGPFASQADALLAALAGFVDDCNALEQSLIFVGTTGQSSTALAVGAGTKTLTASTGKAWVVGAWVHLVSAGGIGNVMVGQVLDYDVDTGELQVNVGAFAGSGTHSDWLIGLSSPQAPITAALIATGALAAKVSAEGGLLLPANADNPLKAVPKQQAEAIADAVWPVGAILAVADLSPPSARWLLVDGKTIGNASSGATARANADTEALFTKLWAFPAASVPIYTSAGAASTRGASAAADFAADKRIALFTPDGGAFLRMWAPGQTKDVGREAGSVQLDAFQGHEHAEYATAANYPLDGGGLGLGTGNYSDATKGILQKAGYSAPRVADETRPYNLAVPHYIKL